MRYRLRTLMIVLAVAPAFIGLVWIGLSKHIPAATILSLVLTCSFLSASLSTLLFYWTIRPRIVLSGTAVGIAGAYAVLMVAGGKLDWPLVFQARPVMGWEGLKCLAAWIIAVYSGLAFGFGFPALARIASVWSRGTSP